MKDRVTWEYEGTLDEKGQMCGKGTLSYRAVKGEKLPEGYADYEGTFLAGKFHGIGKQTWPNSTYEGEYKEGKRHGNFTVYTNSGRVVNMKYKDGEEVVNAQGEVVMKDVTDPHQAWYGDGKPRPVKTEEETDKPE